MRHNYTLYLRNEILTTVLAPPNSSFDEIRQIAISQLDANPDVFIAGTDWTPFSFRNALQHAGVKSYPRERADYWSPIVKIGTRTYWGRFDDKGKIIYNCTTNDLPPSANAGGYYDLNALKLLKGDN